MPSRNDPCPCGRKNEDGAPIKYKYCCLRKKQKENEKFGGDIIMPDGTKKIATWKIFIAATALLALIAGLLVFFNLPRASGAVFGCGMLVVVIYSAFRTPPPKRQEPGGGGNIDFGR